MDKLFLRVSLPFVFVRENSSREVHFSLHGCGGEVEFCTMLAHLYIMCSCTGLCIRSIYISVLPDITALHY